MGEARVDIALARAMALLPAFDYADPQTVRAQMDRFIGLAAAAGLRTMHDQDLQIHDRLVESNVPVRIYVPRERRQPPPAILYLHGGAFVLGDLELEHPRCIEMARLTGATVVSVNYRLAPEHPFPAALDDCYAVYTWITRAGELDIDNARVAVAGASAGGALAAAVTLAARDRGALAPCFQLLLYPVTDDRMTTASMARFVDTPGWNRTNTEHMWSHYIGRQRGTEVSPYAAPARAEDLRGLPPAYIMTADRDALRDEGLQFAQRLIEAGVPTELHHYAGTFHGFDTLVNSDLSHRARAEHYAAFREALE